MYFHKRIFAMLAAVAFVFAISTANPAEAGGRNHRGSGAAFVAGALFGLGTAAIIAESQRGYYGAPPVAYYPRPVPAPVYAVPVAPAPTYYGANLAPSYGYFAPKPYRSLKLSPHRNRRYKKRRAHRVPKHLGLPRQNYRDPTWRRATRIDPRSRLGRYCSRYGC